METFDFFFFFFTCYILYAPAAGETYITEKNGSFSELWEHQNIKIIRAFLFALLHREDMKMI